MAGLEQYAKKCLRFFAIIVRLNKELDLYDASIKNNKDQIGQILNESDLT